MSAGPAACPSLSAFASPSHSAAPSGGARGRAAWLPLARARAVCPAKVFVGGGERGAAAGKAAAADRLYHNCTGGGASLEFLEGLVLPGVAALNDN